MTDVGLRLQAVGMGGVGRVGQHGQGCLSSEQRTEHKSNTELFIEVG